MELYDFQGETSQVRILMRSIGKLQRENKHLQSEMEEHRRTRSFKKMQDDIGKQDVIIKALVARIGVQESKRIIAEALDKGPPRVRSKSRQELLFELEEARRVARRAAQHRPSQRSSTTEEGTALVNKIREELEITQRAEANTRAELELAKKALEAFRHTGNHSSGALTDQQSELIKARKEIDDLSNKLEESCTREEQLASTVKDLSARLGEQQRLSEENKGWVTPSVAEVLKEKEELRRRMIAAEEEAKNLRKQLDLARKGREELMDISKRFKAEKVEAEESAVKLREDVNHFKEESGRFQKECEDVVEKNRVLNEEMIQLRGLLAVEREHTAALSRKVGSYIGEANRGAVMEKSIERMSMAVNVGELSSMAGGCSPAAPHLGEDTYTLDENKSPSIEPGSPANVSGAILKADPFLPVRADEECIEVVSEKPSSGGVVNIQLCSEPMQWGGRDSSRSLAVRNAEFASTLRQHASGKASAGQRSLSGGRQRSSLVSTSISPRRPAKVAELPVRPEVKARPPFRSIESNRQPLSVEQSENQHCSLQQELDESMSELAIVQRRCHSLEESLTIAESQHVKARSMNTRLKERLQLFQDQNAENCRIAEMEISKLVARLAAAEATIGRLQDENNSLDEAVRAQGKELEFLRDAKETLQNERDDAFRGGQKLEESLRELARDFEALSDKYEYERRESQEAKLQLTELMEVSLSQSAKLEIALEKLDRSHAVDIAAAEFRESRLLRRWLPLWKRATLLAKAIRCVGNSVRRGSQKRFCAVILRSWRNHINEVGQLASSTRSLMREWRALSSYRTELAYRAASHWREKSLMNWFIYWQTAGKVMRSRQEAHDLVLLHRGRYIFRWWREALRMNQACTSLLFKRQRRRQKAFLAGLRHGLTAAACGNRAAELRESRITKGAFAEWRGTCDRKVFALRWARLEVPRERLSRTAFNALLKNRRRNQQGRRLALLLGEYLPKAGARRGLQWFRASVEAQRAEAMCRLAIQHLRWRARQKRVLNLALEAATYRQKKLVREIYREWSLVAVRKLHHRQASENIAFRKSFTILRRVLLAWVFRLLESPVARHAKGNEERLQQALQKTASLRSLLRSQEERITVLEAAEHTGTTKLRRLEAIIGKRDDEIDRLRRDIKLLEEINHKLRLTSVLEPLTETISSSSRSSEAALHSFSSSEYDSSGIPSGTGGRENVTMSTIRLDSV